jgi:hypothetical protein
MQRCRYRNRFGVVVIGRTTRRLLSRGSGASPEAPRGSHYAEAKTVSLGSDCSVRAISGGGWQRIQEGLSGTQRWTGANRDAPLRRRRGADLPARSGTLGRPEKAATIGPLQCSTRLTRWRRVFGGAWGGAVASRGGAPRLCGEPSSLGRDFID